MHVKAAGLRLEGNSGGRSEINKVQGSCRKVSMEGTCVIGPSGCMWSFSVTFPWPSQRSWRFSRGRCTNEYRQITCSEHPWQYAGTFLMRKLECPEVEIFLLDGHLCKWLGRKTLRGQSMVFQNRSSHRSRGPYRHWVVLCVSRLWKVSPVPLPGNSRLLGKDRAGSGLCISYCDPKWWSSNHEN